MDSNKKNSGELKSEIGEGLLSYTHTHARTHKY
jgi:hypothetical protein